MPLNKGIEGPSFYAGFAVLGLLALVLSIMPGCDRTQAGIQWDASVSGNNRDITGVGFGAQVAPPAPTPIPRAPEQLEKGNAALVAPQPRPYTEQNIKLGYGDILPDPDVALPAVPTPVRGDGESRSSSSSGSGAWYNGFLP